jgi:hypothetical protein
MATLLGRLIALALIAQMTGESEIRHTLATAAALGYDMLELKREIFGPTVHTLPVELLQDILSDFIPRECPLLIGNASHLRILEELCVKPYQLLGERLDGTDAREALDPGEDIRHPTFQRWRKPPIRATAVVESGLPIARLPSPPAAASRATGFQGFLDLLAAMLHLGRKDHLSRLVIDDGQAGHLAAGIDLQP